MEDFILPSEGGSLKKWVHCASILPKPLGPFLNFREKKCTKKNFKKIKTNCTESGVGLGWRATASCQAAGDQWLATGGQGP
jgi:hypothetical protein